MEQKLARIYNKATSGRIYLAGMAVSEPGLPRAIHILVAMQGASWSHIHSLIARSDPSWAYDHQLAEIQKCCCFDS